jgi:hypothetical protein
MLLPKITFSDDLKALLRDSTNKKPADNNPIDRQTSCLD